MKAWPVFISIFVMGWEDENIWEGKGFCLAILMMVSCLTACGGRENVAAQNNTPGQESAAVQSISQPDTASAVDIIAGREEDMEGEAVSEIPEERQGHDWRTEEWRIGEDALLHEQL